MYEDFVSFRNRFGKSSQRGGLQCMQHSGIHNWRPFSLAQNGVSVTEVAIAVGCDSVSAFIQMFRTMLGTTPRAYSLSQRAQPLAKIPNCPIWTQGRTCSAKVCPDSRGKPYFATGRSIFTLENTAVSTPSAL